MVKYIHILQTFRQNNHTRRTRMDKKTYFDLQKNRYKKGELDWCAAETAKLWPDESAHILRIADEVTRLEFLFDLPWDMERTYECVRYEYPVNWTYMPGEDPEFVYQMNRHRYFICLGQAYAMTRNELYAETFVRLAEDWMAHVPLTETSRDLTWRPIEAGLRGENWTKAILYFESSPAVTDDFMEHFTDCLRCHADYLAGSRRGFQLSSNWGVLENHGLFLIGLALGESSYVETALTRLEEEARVQIFPDGVHWEQSCMYHNEVLHCFLEIIRGLHFFDMEVPGFLTGAMIQMAMADLAWIKPDRHQPLTGDSDDTDLRDMLTASAITATYQNLPESALFKGCGYEQPDFESIWDFRLEGALRYAAVEGRLPKQKNWFLEESGNYYIRNGWEPDAWYLHFRNGSLGGGHGHNDKLHFDIFFCGEDILVDAGRYTYLPCEKRIWLKSAHAHNTILVDGQDYMEYPDAWSCTGLAPELRFPVQERSGITLLEGAHTGFLQRGVNVLLTRKILALEPGVCLIADSAFTSEAHTYSRLFHFNSEGTVQCSDNRCAYKGKHITAEIVFPGVSTDLTLTGSHLSHHYNQCVDNTSLRADTISEGRATLFALFAAGQTPPIEISILPVYDPVRNRTADPECANAFQIATDHHTYEILFRLTDLSGPYDLLQAGNCLGIGRILVSIDGKEPVVFA